MLELKIANRAVCVLGVIWCEWARFFSSNKDFTFQLFGCGKICVNEENLNLVFTSEKYFFENFKQEQHSKAFSGKSRTRTITANDLTVLGKFSSNVKTTEAKQRKKV